MAVQVSREELADLSLACSKLWDLDDNRLEPGRDYNLDLQVGVRLQRLRYSPPAASRTGLLLSHQVGKKSYQQEDVAPRPLFASVNDQALQSRRTYAAFCSLLDNYERYSCSRLSFGSRFAIDPLGPGAVQSLRCASKCTHRTGAS